MADDPHTPPAELPPRRVSRLATKLTLDEVASLTPEVRKELAGHGLEVVIDPRSGKVGTERVQELLSKAGFVSEPVAGDYDKVYDRTSPGYDRVYDRG